MAIQAQMYPDNLGLLPFGGSQDLLMNDPTTNNNNSNNLFLNSCGLNEFGFNLHQKLQLQQQQQQQQQSMIQLQNLQQWNHSLSSDNNGYIFLTSSKNYSNPATSTAAVSACTVATSGVQMPMNLSQSLSPQIDKQQQEIDSYISLQNESLKMALLEQRKQQITAILKRVEEKAVMVLRQKDEELAMARKRTMELEELAMKMEVESQAWQRAAVENESIVVSLSNTLEELKEQACCLTSSNAIEDAESCCHGEDEEDEEAGVAESSGGRGERKEMMTMVCRVCNAGNACVLILPCRHLCSCKACEPFLYSCPLCKSAKRASIEALIS